MRLSGSVKLSCALGWGSPKARPAPRPRLAGRSPLAGVGLRRARQQRLDFLLQLRLGRLHARVAHRLVLARIGPQLGAVHRNRPQLDQPALARQLDDLDEQPGQLVQMQRAEVTQRAVLGEVARAEQPKRHVLVQLAGNLARGEHPGGIGVHQYLDHHRRVEWLVAGAAALVAPVKRAEVQLVDRVADVVGQVVLRQPVAQRRRQQQVLGRLVGQVAGRHV